MKQFPFSSLRVRLFFLVLLAVLPALVLALYTASEERQQAARRAQEDALRLARLAATRQVKLIGETRQLLTAMAQLPHVRRGSSARCNTFFALLLKEYPLYANLGVINQSGQVTCSAIPLQDSIVIADRHLFQNVEEVRDFAMGNFRINQATGKATINLGYPVFGEAGRVQAIVFAVLDLLWLNRLAAEVQLPQGSLLAVVDRQGTILARYPDAEGWIGRVAPEAPIIKKAIQTQKKEGTTEVSEPDRIAHLFAYTVLEDVPQLADVYIIVGIPSEVAFTQANRMLVRNLIWLALVSILAFLAAWIGSDRFILRQIYALVGAAKRLGTGDLSARTGLSYKSGEVGQLAQAFDEMAASMQTYQAKTRQSEMAILENEERYRTVAETASDGIITIDEESRICFVNRAAERIFGYPREEMIGQEVTMLMPQHLRSVHHTAVNRYVETGQRSRSWESVDLSGLQKSGQEVPIEISLGEFLKNGKHFFTAIIRDVTDRKRAEEQIKASLREKEVLLQEIQHRVKNNLQLMSSLLHLQSGYIKDKQVLKMFQEYQTRVKSMALIHEQLYQSKDLARIDFDEYIQALAFNLFRSYGINSEDINLEMDMNDDLLDVDTAVPCGLMITELLSNSLKHAFPGGRKGKIWIELSSDRDHGFILRVRDNGIGFPENLDFRDTNSLGLQLVNTLTAQLGGALELHRRDGTEFEIRFPASINRRRSPSHG